MALADSVPGVSGGTIAFLLGFYDSFINSLNDIMGRDNAKRKKAFFFLIKLGVGWVIGMLLSVSVLANAANITTSYGLLSALLSLWAFPL